MPATMRRCSAPCSGSTALHFIDRVNVTRPSRRPDTRPAKFSATWTSLHRGVAPSFLYCLHAVREPPKEFQEIFGIDPVNHIT